MATTTPSAVLVPTAAAAANAAAMPMARFPPAPAATAAPPTPMPMAVPSTSARLSDADARPSPPGGAFRSIISESGAYASPMPRPATVHATKPTATGTVGWSTRTIPAMPARMITSPVRTKRGPSQVSLSRACTQAPAENRGGQAPAGGQGARRHQAAQCGQPASHAGRDQRAADQHSTGTGNEREAGQQHGGAGGHRDAVDQPVLLNLAGGRRAEADQGRHRYRPCHRDHRQQTQEHPPPPEQVRHLGGQRRPGH